MDNSTQQASTMESTQDTQPTPTQQPRQSRLESAASTQPTQQLFFDDREFDDDDQLTAAQRQELQDDPEIRDTMATVDFIFNEGVRQHATVAKRIANSMAVERVDETIGRLNQDSVIDQQTMERISKYAARYVPPTHSNDLTDTDKTRIEKSTCDDIKSLIDTEKFETAFQGLRSRIEQSNNTERIRRVQMPEFGEANKSLANLNHSLQKAREQADERRQRALTDFIRRTRESIQRQHLTPEHCQRLRKSLRELSAALGVDTCRGGSCSNNSSSAGRTTNEEMSGSGSAVASGSGESTDKSSEKGIDSCEGSSSEGSGEKLASSSGGSGSASDGVVANTNSEKSEEGGSATSSAHSSAPTEKSDEGPHDATLKEGSDQEMASQ